MADANPKIDADPRHCSVFRTDDTGNTFLVRDGLTQDEAELLAAEFAARGHKQTYWIERDRESK